MLYRRLLLGNIMFEKTIDDINEDNLFDSNKKRRRNLNADNVFFYLRQEKIKN